MNDWPYIKTKTKVDKFCNALNTKKKLLLCRWTPLVNRHSLLLSKGIGNSKASNVSEELCTEFHNFLKYIMNKQPWYLRKPKVKGTVVSWWSKIWQICRLKLLQDLSLRIHRRAGQKNSSPSQIFPRDLPCIQGKAHWPLLLTLRMQDKYGNLVQK